MMQQIIKVKEEMKGLLHLVMSYSTKATISGFLHAAPSKCGQCSFKMNLFYMCGRLHVLPERYQCRLLTEIGQICPCKLLCA
jgi:hypothetical protein